jgi:hypothetical protein
MLAPAMVSQSTAAKASAMMGKPVQGLVSSWSRRCCQRSLEESAGRVRVRLAIFADSA